MYDLVIDPAVLAQSVFACKGIEVREDLCAAGVGS
jgi:hypothetical protein